MKKILFNPDNLAKLMFISAFMPLSAALISQYFFNLHPCELCIYQRIPFFIVMAVSFISLIKPRSSKVLIIGTVIAIHAYLLNSGIAFYHVGVEKHWWVHGDCTGQFDMTSIEALKQSIFSKPVTRCDEVQFEFLSLSMAGWNFFYSLVLAIFFVILLVKYFKFNRKG
jgi:disulfide bond formation protein DsbB